LLVTFALSEIRPEQKQFSLLVFFFRFSILKASFRTFCEIGLPNSFLHKSAYFQGTGEGDKLMRTKYHQSRVGHNIITILVIGSSILSQRINCNSFLWWINRILLVCCFIRVILNITYNLQKQLDSIIVYNAWRGLNFLINRSWYAVISLKKQQSSQFIRKKKKKKKIILKKNLVKISDKELLWNNR